jgi:hypothetical protein
MDKLLQKVIDKYSSQKLLDDVEYVEATVSTKGLAFILKQRDYFKDAKLLMSVDKTYSKITPIGKEKEISGVFDGNDVWLEDKHGNIIQKRNNAREYFLTLRHWLYWDDLDMAYFANYAFWNYFTFGVLLLNKNIIWEQESESILKATFDDSFPTHSKIQRFHFSDEGLLLQHDYCADVISKYANAANKVLAHEEKDGFLFSSKRIVTPRFGTKVLTSPALIDIDVTNINLIYK